MNAQNIEALVIKMSKAGVNGAKMSAKIAQGFVDGDVIPMSGEREIRIENGVASGYNKDVKENSFELAALPAAQIEGLMAQYIVANCGLSPQKIF
jgi:hypothetical protein